MLDVVIGGAMVLTVFTWLTNAEEKARQDLERRQKRLKSRIKEMKQDLETAQRLADESARFKKYIVLYGAAVEQSNDYYKDYDAQKKYVALLHEKRKAIGAKIGKLKTLRDNATGEVRYDYCEQLSQHYAWLDEIKAEIAKQEAKKQEQFAQLQQINDNKYAIRYYLRDNCGRGGRIWYERNFSN